jgi:hypothetical protein
VLVGHAAHADLFQDLVDPTAGKPGCLGETEEMVIGAAPPVEGFGVEQGTHLAQRPAVTTEGTAIDRYGTSGGSVKT